MTAEEPRARSYYEKNRKARRAYQAKRYQRLRPLLLLQQRRYEERKRRSIKKYRPWLKFWKNARYRAKRAGLPFALTHDEIKFIWDRDNGWRLQRRRFKMFSARLGYTLGNCFFHGLGPRKRKSNKIKS